MKKEFVGYINGEKFTDMKLFAKALQTVDLNDGKTIISSKTISSFDDKDQSSKNKQKNDSSDKKLDAPKESKITADMFLDPSFKFSKDDLKHMSDTEIASVGYTLSRMIKNLSNDYDNAKDNFKRTSARIGQLVDRITDLEAAISDLRNEAEEYHKKEDELKKSLEQMVDNGSKLLIDEYLSIREKNINLKKSSPYSIHDFISDIFSGSNPFTIEL